MISVSYDMFTDINNSIAPLCNLSSTLCVSTLTIPPSSVPARDAPTNTRILWLISAPDSFQSELRQ